MSAWLGVENAFPRTTPSHRKLIVRPLRAALANYDEVTGVLRGTGFEYCLEDERMYREEAGDPARA